MESEIKYKSFCKKNISNIAFGCATLANIYNPISEIDSCDLVYHAFNRGINYFDVAPFYGGGLAEKRLGICIKNLNRNDIFLATKIGRYTSQNSNSGAGGYFDFTPSMIEKSIKQSMSNMETNYIDLIQCHDIENVKMIDILNCLPLLEHFKSTQKIGGIGINSYPLQPLLNVLDNSKIKVDSIGTYAHHTLINDSILEIIPEMKKKNVEIINSSPLGMGLLTEKGPPIWHPASILMCETVNNIKLYCKNNSENISNIAMRYSLSNNELLTNITGANSINEIEMNINSLNNNIPDTYLKDISIIAYPIKNKLWGPEDGITPIYNWDYI